MKSIKVFENYLNVLVDNSIFCEHKVPCKNATTFWFIIKTSCSFLYCGRPIENGSHLNGRYDCCICSRFILLSNANVAFFLWTLLYWLKSKTETLFSNGISKILFTVFLHSWTYDNKNRRLTLNPELVTDIFRTYWFDVSNYIVSQKPLDEFLRQIVEKIHHKFYSEYKKTTHMINR